MIEEIVDLNLLLLATSRFSSLDESKLISMEQLMAENGITQEEIDSMEDVDIE